MNRTQIITTALATLVTLSGCADLPEDPTADISAAVSARSCTSAPAFTHVATTANVHGSYSTPAPYATAINAPSTNGHPEAILHVTPNWTPNGSASRPNYHPVGVWYDLSTSRWNVYNEDGAPMTVGTGFNVRVGNGFVVRSASYVDNTNGFGWVSPQLPSSAILFATAVSNPGGSAPGANNWSPLAVYNLSEGTTAAPSWLLMHSDGVPFDPNVAYNIVADPCGRVRSVDSSNPPGADYVLREADTNARPGAVVFVTRRFGSTGASQQANPGHLAVHYDAAQARWKVRGWSNTAESMPFGAIMNVLVR